MGGATSSRQEVLTTFHFYVDGVGQAVFTDVSGLSVETMVQEYEEGGRNDHIHRLPGRIKVSDITLKNGITTSNELWDWWKKIMQGTFERRNVSIVMVDQTGQEVTRWSFIEALPVKWVGPEFKAGQSAAAIQSLQLAHRGLQTS
jgi:phage tail-like protein